MRIDDILYFAPEIPFNAVDFNSPQMPVQFQSRIEGFYLAPARRCVDAGFAFAAGSLAVVCIDALARFQVGGKVGPRFKAFVRRELRSFASETKARQLYDEFRNGLIHEARIKRGAQFSLDADATITEIGGVLLVNPARLTEEVTEALGNYVDRLVRDSAERRRLARLLVADHADDV
jgi:hypothetical protein